jgi:hypothetical protein
MTSRVAARLIDFIGAPKGNRTPVFAVKEA